MITPADLTKNMSNKEEVFQVSRHIHSVNMNTKECHTNKQKKEETNRANKTEQTTNQKKLTTCQQKYHKASRQEFCASECQQQKFIKNRQSQKLKQPQVTSLTTQNNNNQNKTKKREREDKSARRHILEFRTLLFRGRFLE